MTPADFRRRTISLATLAILVGLSFAPQFTSRVEAVGTILPRASAGATAILSATITATPNPTPDGTVTITWKSDYTDDELCSECYPNHYVYAKRDGVEWDAVNNQPVPMSPYPVFGRGRSGSRTISGIELGSVYEFIFVVEANPKPKTYSVTVTRATPATRRAVIFIGGIISHGECTGTGLPQEAPGWLGGWLLLQPWIRQKVTITDKDLIYFSYSGRYCDGGTGEFGAIPDYIPGDTCFHYDTTYYPRLKGLIERVASKSPNMQIVLVGHSQGGLLATYTVGRLRDEKNVDLLRHIGSVVTFDSFPTGLPPQVVDTVNFIDGVPFFLPDIFKTAKVNGKDVPGCDPATAVNYADWKDTSPVAQAAQRATLSYDQNTGEHVYFYTLAGGTIGVSPENFSIGGDSTVLESLKDRSLTSIAGEVLHEKFGSDTHISIWATSSPRKQEIVGCALVYDLACDIYHHLIAQGQTILAQATIPANTPQAHLGASWVGSTVTLNLVQPDGTHITPTSLPPGISYEATPTFSAYTISTPQPGQWTLELYGADIPPGGEEVLILSDMTGRTLSVNDSAGGRARAEPSGGIYAPGALVTLWPDAEPGQIFTGWVVDGVAQGWAVPLTVTMNAAHTIQATFTPIVSFTDVPTGRPYSQPIAELAARGYIRGYGDGSFGPDDRTLRAQMAALIARAMGYTDTPTNPFTDKCDQANPIDCVDSELWNRVAQLASRAIAKGYTDAPTCAPANAPCYAPRDFVLYAQTLSFITRAMVNQGYWQQQPSDPNLFGGVLAGTGHEQDVTTYLFYTQSVGGIPDYPAGGNFAAWDQSSTRGWFARALWTALNSYFGTDRVP